MKFKIGDFIVFTEQKIIELEETYFKPIKLNYQKTKIEEYQEAKKTKEITVFRGLSLLEKYDNKHYQVISDLFDFIDLIEILKAFSANKLDTTKIYQISDLFTAKIAQKDGNISLSIYFTNYSFNLYLDKFECSSLAAKFGKILQRVEAWQEQDQ
jgi:hypothetical protein